MPPAPSGPRRVRIQRSGVDLGVVGRISVRVLVLRSRVAGHAIAVCRSRASSRSRSMCTRTQCVSSPSSSACHPRHSSSVKTHVVGDDVEAGTCRAPYRASPRGEHLTADRSHAHPKHTVDDLEHHALLGVHADVLPGGHPVERHLREVIVHRVDEPALAIRREPALERGGERRLARARRTVQHDDRACRHAYRRGRPRMSRGVGGRRAQVISTLGNDAVWRSGA